MQPRRRLTVVSADEQTVRVVRESCSGAFEVEATGARPDLLAYLRRKHPAVLVLDSELSDLDAFSVLTQIHKVSELRTTVTLFLISRAGVEHAREARKLGADDVVGKPIDANDLKIRIEGALARRMPQEGRQRLGELLVHAGVVGREQLEQALKLQSEEGGRLGAILVREGFCTELELAESLAVQMHIAFVDLRTTAPSASAIGLLPREFIMRHRVMPLRVDEKDNLVLAMTNPLDVVVVDEAALRSGKRVVAAICTESGFDEAVTIYLSTRGRLRESGDRLGEHDSEPPIPAGVDESVIETVDALIADAAGMKASDIHLEPVAGGMRVRCRIDGVLHELRELNEAMTPGIVSRLKIMGSMDIAERRLPQDGRTSFETSSGQQLDLRLASIPSLYGENITVRLLEVSASIPTLDDLGLSGAARARYESAVAVPEGGIIISGPTGSGKSTTLYATLESINDPARKIYTVEDPIERTIPGIVQTEIRDQIGLSFSRALRALVRADPDVIMVGEIRDLETARMAADSAVTGHLVFTTVHANDAAATLYRLIEIGLPRYVVAAAFRCVVAQRLVRRLCRSCRRPVELSAERWEALGLGKAPAPVMTVSEPVGCGRCFGTGYLGRIGIFEVLDMDEEIANSVTTGTAADIRRIAAGRGIDTIHQDGVAKVLDGTTSYLELMRVTA